MSVSRTYTKLERKMTLLQTQCKCNGGIFLVKSCGDADPRWDHFAHIFEWLQVFFKLPPQEMTYPV